MIDPSYETPSKTFFVMREGKGMYRVLRNDATRAIIVATFRFKSNAPKALSMAIKDADWREEIKFGSAS